MFLSLSNMYLNFPNVFVTRKGLGPRWVCSSTVWNMWVVNFLQGRVHHTGPGDFDSTFIKAGDSEIKEQKRQDHSSRSEPRHSCLGSLETWGRVESGQGCLSRLERQSQRQKKWASWATWTQETSYRGKRMALGDRFRRLAQDKMPLPAAYLVVSLLRTFRTQEKESKDTCLRKGRGGSCVLKGECTLGALSYGFLFLFYRQEF